MVRFIPDSWTINYLYLKLAIITSANNNADFPEESVLLVDDFDVIPYLQGVVRHVAIVLGRGDDF